MSSDDNIGKKVAEYSKTFEITIKVTNITSSKEITNSATQPISISEFLEKGMVINLPPLSGAQGHQLLLDIHLSEGIDQLLVFNTTAKIMNIESTEEATNRVTLKFVQFDPFIWKKFQRIYQDCQKELQILLASLKGPNK